MFIRVVPRGDSTEVRLEDADNFRQFHLVVEQLDDEALAAALSAAGAGEYRGGYVWIRHQFIEDQAASTSADWLAQFTAMLEFARERGWISPDGTAVRAHVERS